MGHPRDADELLEVSGDELRSVVGDDPWFCLRILLPSSLQDDFDFRFGHRFPQIPMDDRTAKAIQNAAQVVEGTAHVDVGNRYANAGAGGVAARSRFLCATVCPSIGRATPLVEEPAK